MPLVGRRMKKKFMVMTTDRKAQNGTSHSYTALLKEVGRSVRKC